MNRRHLHAIVLLCLCTAGVMSVHRADAATITGSYVAGHRNVTINDYGTSGLGMFVLDTGDRNERAWCIEADVPHARSVDAYAEVDPVVRSAELDALVWLLDRKESIDDDTATATAALAWYYAGARRTIGPLVWSDGSSGFAAISPVDPRPWDALPPFSMSHPVGLRAGTIDLDAAERQVAALHRQATAWRGPWSLAATTEPGGFVLRGPAGPIVGADVDVTVEAPGRVATKAVLRTARDGTVRIDLPTMPDGGRVLARADSPGPHREWDGAGAVQRMATSTNRVVTATSDLPPLHRHLELVKTSSDPTISVAGARFELVDANGRTIERATTDATGRVRWAPVDPIRHPGPYRIVETGAPVGLLRADPVEIAAASHDPRKPTTVEVVNHPANVDLVVRKRLSVDGVGPGDLAGFEFTVTREADRLQRTAATDDDGETAPIAVTLGRWEVCETAGPAWADTLVDTGCRTVTVGPDAIGPNASIVVEYVNEVPTPTIDTIVADAVDGDRALPAAGGTAIDHVTIDGLVPATAYRLDGELLTATGEPTGVSSTVTFVASDRSATMQMMFSVPVLEPRDYVVVQRLVLDHPGGATVAVHADLDDRDQTLTILPPPPTTTSTTTPTTTTTPPTTTIARTSTPTATMPPTTMPPTTTSTTTIPASIAPPTLPRTGADRTVSTALRVADLAFAAGVGLCVLAGIAPRRRRSS